jgi:hypothetical protein
MTAAIRSVTSRCVARNRETANARWLAKLASIIELGDAEVTLSAAC